MPQPTPNQVHFDRPLSNISIAFMQSADVFIADKVFPVVPVTKQSDRYWTYDRRDWKRRSAKERAPATESAGGGWRVNADASYFSKVYAVHKDVDDQTRKNADEQLDMDRDATEWVTAQLLLEREFQWAAKYFATGIWANQRNGVSGAPAGTDFQRWDEAASTPIEDVKGAVITVAEETGKRPNVLALHPRVYTSLSDHPDILDRIKYTERGIVTAELLAALFGIPKVVVAWGIQDTSAEGSAAEVSEFIMGKHALLAYAEPSPGLMKASAGYIFGWNGLLGTGAWNGPAISRFRREKLKADRIEGELAFDAKVVAADLGFFFRDAIS